MDRSRERERGKERDGSGRPAVYDVHCPDCGYLNAQLSNGSFTHLRCKNGKCKVYFTGYMVGGTFVCIEGKGRQSAIMQAGPPTFIG